MSSDKPQDIILGSSQKFRQEDVTALLDFVQSRIGKNKGHVDKSTLSESNDTRSNAKWPSLVDLLSEIINASPPEARQHLRTYSIVSNRNRDLADRLELATQHDRENVRRIFDNSKPTVLYIENTIKVKSRKVEISTVSAWDNVLNLEGVPQQLRERLRVAFRAEIARAIRPKWADRLDHRELRTLTAPQFLKTVHAAEIGPDGSVSTEVIRAIDADLMKAVEVYVGQRRRRNVDMGDAAGLKLILERPRSSQSREPTRP